MKNFLSFSFITMFLIVGFYAANILSQKPADKLSAYKESLRYEKNKDYAAAIKSLMKVYDTNKEEYLMNVRLGWLQYLAGEMGNSKKYYTKAISLQPGSVEPLLGITLPLSAGNEWDAVAEAYKKILSLDDDNYTANLRYGQILLNKQDYQGSVKFLEKARNYFPSEYEPMLSLGWSYYYLGKTADARNLFSEVLLVNPDESSAAEGLKLLR